LPPPSTSTWQPLPFMATIVPRSLLFSPMNWATNEFCGRS
jgi:hypothetical protein